jgi:hypothetical protein
MRGESLWLIFLDMDVLYVGPVFGWPQETCIDVLRTRGRVGTRDVHWLDSLSAGDEIKSMWAA